jgi:hypothetical protein
MLVGSSHRRTRRVSTVTRYVNFDRVRAWLTEQIASGCMRRSGIQPGPLAQQAVVVGLSVADPVIRKLVSPEALSELLAVGWPVAVVLFCAIRSAHVPCRATLAKAASISGPLLTLHTSRRPKSDIL